MSIHKRHSALSQLAIKQKLNRVEMLGKPFVARMGIHLSVFRACSCLIDTFLSLAGSGCLLLKGFTFLARIQSSQGETQSLS